jgi:hypothetical protein
MHPKDALIAGNSLGQDGFSVTNLAGQAGSRLLAINTTDSRDLHLRQISCFIAAVLPGKPIQSRYNTFDIAQHSG